MKIFLSWSGEKSRIAAEAFRDWLPLLINAAKPWASGADIDAGARWNRAIQEKLEATTFGILFVTRSNVTAPWLLFEAGALAKTLNGTFVCPYLLDLKPSGLPSSGPLTQFQAQEANREGTLKLVETINGALTEGSVAKDQLQMAFEAFWERLEKALQEIPNEGKGTAQGPSSAEMLAEVLGIARRLDRRRHLDLTSQHPEKKKSTERIW